MKEMKCLLFAWGTFFTAPSFADAACRELLEPQEQIVKQLSSEFVDFYVWQGYIHVIPDFASWDWLNWIAAYISLHYEKELLILAEDNTEEYSGAVVLRFSEYARLREAFPTKKEFLKHIERIILLEREG